MLEENKKVELNEEQVEDVDGGLFAEMGLAAAMVFGQVAPLAAEMNVTPEVQETGEQASTIALTNANVQLMNTLTEDGTEQTQQVQVVVNGVVLQPGTEYTVQGNTATQAGTYTLTIQGKGMYSGTVNVDFTVQATQEQAQPEEAPETAESKDEEITVDKAIEQTDENQDQETTDDHQLGAKLDINECTVEVAQATYNGSPQLPEVTVKDADGNVLQAGTDYELNTQEARQENAGTYNFTIHGLGNYDGTTKEASFTIAPAVIDTVQAASQLVYNGQDQAQPVTVKAGDLQLTDGQDYDISGNVGKNAGTYQLTVNGKGNFTGLSIIDFTVAQATLGDENVKLSENLVYNKKEQTQKVTVTYNGMTLTEGTDYDVTNNKATNKGNYTLTVTGKGNFAGAVNKTFTIYSEKEVVKTGENTNIGLFAGLTGAAVAMFGALLVLNKKRSK